MLRLWGAADDVEILYQSAYRRYCYLGVDGSGRRGFDAESAHSTVSEYRGSPDPGASYIHRCGCQHSRRIGRYSHRAADVGCLRHELHVLDKPQHWCNEPHHRFQYHDQCKYRPNSVANASKSGQLAVADVGNKRRRNREAVDRGTPDVDRPLFAEWNL